MQFFKWIYRFGFGLSRLIYLHVTQTWLKFDKILSSKFWVIKFVQIIYIFYFLFDLYTKVNQVLSKARIY